MIIMISLVIFIFPHSSWHIFIMIPWWGFPHETDTYIIKMFELLTFYDNYPFTTKCSPYQDYPFRKCEFDNSFHYTVSWIQSMT